MRRPIYLALVALVATVSFAIKKQSDNSVKTLTDKQLEAAIDSCMRHDLPRSAEPYFAEAKRRAKSTNDTRQMLILIDKELSLNANRIETTENMLTAIDKEIASAWTPLTEMLMLRKAIVSHWKYNTFATDIAARRDTLSRLSAYCAVDSNDIIVPMSLYDYMMLSAVELSCLSTEDSIMKQWSDEGTPTSKILYEMLKARNGFNADEMRQITQHIHKLAFSPETEALAYFVSGDYYSSMALINDKPAALSDAYADTAVAHLQKAAKVLRGKALKLTNDKLNKINAKGLEVGVRRAYIPNSNIPIHIATKNLEAVDVDIYRINNGDVKDFNPTNEKPVATYHFSIPKARGRVDRQETYTELRELPFGHYEIVARHDTLLARNHFQVTDISAMNIYNNGETQIVLRSATDGEPLPKATIDGKNVDDFGMLTIDKKWKNRKVCNGNDQIEISASGYSRGKFRDRTDTRIAIVTDRKIYRPGQTVELKAWLYKANYEKKWAETKPQKLEVVLRSHNDTKIADTTIVTNDFGTASCKLRIPTDIDLGYANIEINAKRDKSASSYCSISIEEYKRSGNRIEFEPIKVAIAPGDSVEMSGHAFSADNKPIIDAQIEIEDELNDTICTVRTDAEGRFSYTLATDSTDVYEDYPIYAKMTDLAGETTEAETRVVVSEYGSSLELFANNEFENTDSISFRLRSDNFNNQPYRNKVTYTICKMRPSRGYKPYVGLESDTIIGSTTHTYERFPIYTVADTILRKTVEVNGDTTISISAKDMATGIYRITTEATSYTGKALGAERDFCLRAHEGKCELRKEIYLGRTDKQFTPGKDYHFYVGSNLPKAKMLVLVEYAGKIIDRRYVALSGEIKQLSVAIPVSKLNYMELHIMASIAKDNETFYESMSVQKAEENTDLDMQLATWHDHNVPGATQTATFTIGSKSGAPEAEVLASMYDTRLDRILKNKWDTRFYRNSLNSYSNCGFLDIQRGSVSWHKDAPKLQNGHTFINHINIYSNRDIIDITTLDLDRYNPMDWENLYYHVGNKRSKNEVLAVGYGAKRMSRSNAVAMEEDAVELNEEVVVAYGYSTQKKSLVTAAAALQGKLQGVVETTQLTSSESTDEPTTPQLRTDFRETVFFEPHLRTDASGKVSATFTLPDNITTYRLQAIAHDKQMNSGYISKTLVVSKPLTVKAWLPRVVTEGDTIIVSMTATCDSVCSNITANFDMNGNVQSQTSEQTSKQHRFSFNIVVPDGADSLRIALSATNGNFTDGERHTLPVQLRHKQITESKPFIIMNKGMHTLKNPFADNDKNLASSFSYTCNTWSEVLRALPHLHNSPFPSSDTYLGQVESSAIAMMLMKRADVHQWVDSLSHNINSSVITKHNMEKNSPWVRFNDFQTRHDKDVLRMLNDNTSRNTYNTALRKLQKMQLSDGSFPWFSGMDGSEYITRHILSTLGMLLRYGMVNSADVSEMCQKGQAYIERQITEEVERWERDKVKAPVADALMLHRLYTLSCLKGINTANAQLKRAIDAIPVASKMREPSSKLMAAIIYNRIGRTKEAQRLLQSVCENLVRPDEYTAHISLNGRAWYCNTTLVHSMLIMAMNELTPNNADQPRIINWLLREKRTTHWHDTQATSRAVLAMLTQSTDNRHTDVVSTANDSYNVTTELTLAPSPAEVKIDHTSPLVSWGNWQRTALLATDQMPANNSADISLVRTIEGGNKVGDKVTITLTITTVEDMDFVRISDYRPAAFEPIDQTSQYRGWWWFARRIDGLVPHYFSPRDASVDFFVEHLPRGTHRFSYQCYVTNAGAMTAGYAEAVCMYIDGMDAHTEGRKLKVEN